MATLTHSPPRRLESQRSASLYEQVMGTSFHRLHPAIRNFHRARGARRFQGTVTTHAPTTSLGRALGGMLGTPLRSSSGTLVMNIEADAQHEAWERWFPDQVMRSAMHVSRGRLVERLGSATLTFDLIESAGRLQMRLVRLRFMGIPCPSWLMPRVRAEERGQGMELHFEVQASLPLAGIVASYRGWLIVVHHETA